MGNGERCTKDSHGNRISNGARAHSVVVPKGRKCRNVRSVVPMYVAKWYRSVCTFNQSNMLNSSLRQWLLLLISLGEIASIKIK